MKSAVEAIEQTYDSAACKEIVNVGCANGACQQHSYQADTLMFYMNYEDEIIEYTGNSLGHTFLANLAREHGSPLKNRGEAEDFPWDQVVSACPEKDEYKHALVWKFIELVAIDVLSKQKRNKWSQLDVNN